MNCIEASRHLHPEAAPQGIATIRSIASPASGCRRTCSSRCTAAAKLRAELVELCELLLERTDHLVAPLFWPFMAEGEPAPPVPLTLHGHYFCAEMFDEATRYNDYAISPREFHRESQSLTSEASATGQRPIHHRERGSRVLLFVREVNKRRGVTLPFLRLGFADYGSHKGARPLAIRWRLQRPIAGAFYPELAMGV